MKSGDRFILVTDGVTEAENAMAISTKTSGWKRRGQVSHARRNFFPPSRNSAPAIR